MSLRLAYSIPKTLTIKTYGWNPYEHEPIHVYLAGTFTSEDISMKDFCRKAMEYLTAPENPYSVRLGCGDASSGDFEEAVKYVLTNTDLAGEDPREAFVREVKALRVPQDERVKLYNFVVNLQTVEGFRNDGKRFDYR